MKPSRFSLLSTWLLALLTSAAAAAERMLTSTALSPCRGQKDNKFTATLFDVTFTPGNGTLAFDVNGVSSIKGNVVIGLSVYAYGLNVYEKEIDPCEDGSDLKGLCPMQVGDIRVDSNAQIPQSALKDIPGITYTIPDLDARVQVFFNTSGTHEALACVEAELSNGKTVNQRGVAWALAVISGLALVASAITSGLGHSNTAAHVAANALSLFGYFQAQAFIGLSSVDLPPVVSSWTQNFQWTMGIIEVPFIQTLATWYQRATGGQPSQLLTKVGTVSVQVQKRSVDVADRLMKRALDNMHHQQLVKRTNQDQSNSDTANNVVVRGITRVGYLAGIEETNIFMTGYIFYLIFVLLVVLGVVAFKFVCEGLVKAGKMKGDTFLEFRSGWTTVLRGILYRIVLIGFPQMVVLCFWEFTRVDSGAIVALAVFTIVAMIGVLGWASSKVIRLGRRSIAMHKNPAYILYSDPQSLNKWGFLYVQFKATAFFFIVPFLFYIFLKGLFIGLAQGSGVAQAVALVVIEAVYLIAVSIMTPYMDKKTNAFNISICVISFVSAIFLLIFSNVFNQPGIVTGVIGVIFFVANAVFTCVLLILVLVASVIAIASKNPETRYQPMRDDRGSFIKSATQLNAELDALGATARGESKHGLSGSKARIEDDDDSLSGDSSNQHPMKQSNTAYGGPGFISQDQSRNPSFRPDTATTATRTGSYASTATPGGGYGAGAPGSGYGAGAPGGGGGGGYPPSHFRGGPPPSSRGSPSPWQRGAGYD